MKLTKAKPKDLDIDHRFQRELNESRVASMAENIDLDRLGVPVVSKRPNGALVILDGQHRVSALVAAGLGNKLIHIELHEGLSVQDEAALFLALNTGRKAVGALDKYKARLEAKEPVALEIQKVVKGFKLRIGRGNGARTINAIDAVEFVHRRRDNLHQTLAVLAHWADGDPTAFNGKLVRAVGEFLSRFPEAKPLLLAKQLEEWAPDRVISKIKRLTRNATPTADAFCDVLFEIYNRRLKRTEKLKMPLSFKEAAK